MNLWKLLFAFAAFYRFWQLAFCENKNMKKSFSFLVGFNHRLPVNGGSPVTVTDFGLVPVHRPRTPSSPLFTVPANSSPVMNGEKNTPLKMRFLKKFWKKLNNFKKKFTNFRKFSWKISKKYIWEMIYNILSINMFIINM